MQTLKKILVPVDLSPGSALALHDATTLAERYGASLTVLHVWQPPQMLGSDTVSYPAGETLHSITQQIENAAIRQTQRFAAQNSHPNRVETQIKVVSGVPYMSIVEIAESEDPDLIVMGTHGRTGLTRFFLGSVAEKVVRHAPCSVLTVRGKSE